MWDYVSQQCLSTKIHLHFLTSQTGPNRVLVLKRPWWNHRCPYWVRSEGATIVREKVLSLNFLDAEKWQLWQTGPILYFVKIADRQAHNVSQCDLLCSLLMKIFENVFTYNMTWPKIGTARFKRWKLPVIVAVPSVDRLSATEKDSMSFGSDILVNLIGCSFGVVCKRCIWVQVSFKLEPLHSCKEKAAFLSEYCCYWYIHVTHFDVMCWLCIIYLYDPTVWTSSLLSSFSVCPLTTPHNIQCVYHCSSPSTCPLVTHFLSPLPALLMLYCRFTSPPGGLVK